MRAPSIVALSMSVIGVAAFVLIAHGRPGRADPKPAPVTRPAPSSITVGGFTLTSDNIDLPMDDERFPAGPNADLINASCTSCHSASMILTQPSLSADQWRTVVMKMKQIYMAPIADEDIPAIVDGLSHRRAAPPVPES